MPSPRVAEKPARWVLGMSTLPAATPRSGSLALAMGRPQFRQVRAPGSLGSPQVGQTTPTAPGSGVHGCRGVPGLGGRVGPLMRPEARNGESPLLPGFSLDLTRL